MVFKNKWYILSAVLSLTVIFTAIMYANINGWYSGGQKTANGEVIARIDGKEITEKDFEMALWVEEQKYEFQLKKYEREKQHADENVLIPLPQRASPEQVLDRLIDNEVLYQEAKSQGLEVSYEEAKNYMEQVRKTTNDIMEGEIQVADREEFMESQKLIKQSIEKMGISEDEYWNRVVQAYQKSLAISRLKAKVLSSMPEEVRKDPEKVRLYFEQYAKDLRRKHKVEILKKDF
ncbi:SurA N-terminal domain-containing protein [Thermosediminibacter litoriperuensis]|uniref:SurA-like protein n=1 Tax=Thermosediminibacter litoriperuensis TaxID=291989 RepID=A0A5S5AI37_9FIRM|nr:SurA N-terminal domain-containing protein [Thermosediminibacter litoriperuensis]TYP50345.1 SurA-like protein [Thermosediminibacter litoriperuensis]